MRYGIAAGIAAGTAGALAAGALLWKRDTDRAVRRLMLASGAPATPQNRAELPAPVRRYFDFAVPPGAPPIHWAVLKQAGEMRASAGAPWKRFTAVEYFSPSAPGFVWDARMSLAPCVSLRIRDSYAAGRGESLASIAGLIPLGSKTDTPEVASASLLRYLAEAAWAPAALLDDRISWEALDDRHSRARLADSGLTVSIDVEFGERCEIVRVSALRFRDVKGVPVLTPWSGRFENYVPMRGLMIPASAEVEWILPEGPVPVWRGRITSARYGTVHMPVSW